MLYNVFILLDLIFFIFIKFIMMDDLNLNINLNHNFDLNKY